MPTPLEPLVLQFDVDDRGSVKVKTITKSVQGLETNLNDSAKKITLFDKAIGGLGNGFNRIKASVFSLKTAIGALGLGLTIKSFTDVASSLELAERRLAIFTGSSEAAKTTMAGLRELAKKLPIDFDDLVNAAGRLAPVFGKNTDLLIEFTSKAADLTTLDPSKSAEEIAGGITKAFSSGIASADILREAGITAFLGIGEAGKKTGDDLIKVFREAFDAKKLTGAAQGLNSTFSGILSQLRDRFADFVRITFIDSGVFETLKRSLDRLNTALDEFFQSRGKAFSADLSGNIEKIADGVVSLAGNLDLFLTGIKVLVEFKLAKILIEIGGAFLSAGAAAGTFRASLGAIKPGPLLVISAAAVAFLALMEKIRKDSPDIFAGLIGAADTVIKVFSGVWNTLSGLFQGLLGEVKALVSFLSGGKLGSSFNDNFDDFGKRIAQAKKDFSSVFELSPGSINAISEEAAKAAFQPLSDAEANAAKNFGQQLKAAGEKFNVAEVTKTFGAQFAEAAQAAFKSAEPAVAAGAGSLGTTAGEALVDALNDQLRQNKLSEAKGILEEQLAGLRLSSARGLVDESAAAKQELEFRRQTLEIETQIARERLSATGADKPEQRAAIEQEILDIQRQSRLIAVDTEIKLLDLTKQRREEAAEAAASFREASRELGIQRLDAGASLVGIQVQEQLRLKQISVVQAVQAEEKARAQVRAEQEKIVAAKQTELLATGKINEAAMEGIRLQSIQLENTVEQARAEAKIAEAIEENNRARREAFRGLVTEFGGLAQDMQTVFAGVIPAGAGEVVGKVVDAVELGFRVADRIEKIGQLIQTIQQTGKLGEALAGVGDKAVTTANTTATAANTAALAANTAALGTAAVGGAAGAATEAAAGAGSAVQVVAAPASEGIPVDSQPGFLSGIRTAVADGFSFFKQTAGDLITGMKDAGLTLVEGLAGAGKSLLVGLGSLFGQNGLLGSLTGFAGTLTDSLGGLFGGLTGSLGGLFGGLTGSLGGLFSSVLGGFSGVFQGLLSGIGGLFGGGAGGAAGGGLGGLLFGALGLALAPFTGGASLALGSLGPMLFAKGGFVPGPKGAGDVVPAMLSPGELVLTAENVKALGLGRANSNDTFARQALQMMQRSNSGRDSGGGVEIVNLIEPDLFDRYVQSRRGRRTVVNILREERAI